MALWKRQLLPSLFLGIWIGEIIITKGSVFRAFLRTLDDSLRVAGIKSNLEIILFSIMVGSILALIRESNGFQGFINWFEKKNFHGRKTLYLLTNLIGIAIFIECYSNILINGSIMRPLYTKMKISREKLAYFIHTISINYVALIVINSWGAFYMSLLVTQNVDNPLLVIIRSIPYNFYCLASLVLIIIVMGTGFTLGPMRKAEKTARVAYPSDQVNKNHFLSEISNKKKYIKPSVINMIFPIGILLVMVFLGLYITGGGKITKGSGTSSVFYAVFITIVFTSIFFTIKKLFRFQELLDIIFKGISELIPVGALIVFALTMGDMCKQMGTGTYLAEFAKHNIPVFLLPAIVFALSCFISFSTGTSFGTFAIMVPIAIPMAVSMGINISLIFAACVSGGVFGDNCSPISDTSIVTGMATRINVVDHVKTQIPFALISASVAFLLFILVGLFQ
jgi:Na+/H+ antiporter NhaC